VDIYKIKKDMKRLRKFNESKTDIDYDYIYQCFAELLDDNKAEIREYENRYLDYLTASYGDFGKYITIDLKVKKSNPETRDTSRSMKIENSKLLDYINDIKSNSELLQEVEVALNRLSEEYPEYKVNFDVYAYSIHINIFAGEEKKEQYPF
jgi:hypothetical protein